MLQEIIFMLHTFTAKEVEVIRLFAEGKTAKQVAKYLNVGVRTIDSHKLHAHRKIKKLTGLNLLNILDVVKFALFAKIINIEDVGQKIDFSIFDNAKETKAAVQAHITSINLQDKLKIEETTDLTSENKITAKERQVLELVVKGYQSKAIAVKLDMGVRTTETHRLRLNRKARQHYNMPHSSFPTLCRFAMDLGIIVPSELGHPETVRV
jgi:DNA-binding CsgD family transcriptional regulator